jgi:actin-related protein
MFAGYASRIEKEIKALYIEKGLKNTKDKSIKVPINIIDSPRRKYSVFIGATVLANIYNEQQTDYWITKQDWDECGPDIIFKKCQNIIL